FAFPSIKGIPGADELMGRLPAVTGLPSMPFERRAASTPSHCFQGIGKPHLPLNADGTCPAGSRQRTPEGYAWGYATDQVNENLWVGTWSAAGCAGNNQMSAAMRGIGGVAPKPFDAGELACEFDAKLGQIAPNTGILSDSEPPNIYMYDTKADKLVKKTP